MAISALRLRSIVDCSGMQTASLLECVGDNIAEFQFVPFLVNCKKGQIISSKKTKTTFISIPLYLPLRQTTKHKHFNLLTTQIAEQS